MSATASYAVLGSNESTTLPLPPLELWDSHREWFWPRDKRVLGQLCWSNSSLQAFIIKNVKRMLTSQPDATIVSISQNDVPGVCQAPEELAIMAAEGTPGGPMFRAINNIAAALQDEYPNVAVDTLAYQQTMSAPKITRPRHNVIIRLCADLARWDVPFSDPINPFHSTVVSWGRISNRTYVWNYITNFQNFLVPFPDWYVAGRNVKFLVANGVRGIYQEGAYTGPGGDMTELKDFLLSRMMYDPSLNDREVIADFVLDYYGGAAPFVQNYLDIMHGSVLDTGYVLTQEFAIDAPFLTPIALLTSAAAFVQGRAAVRGTMYEERLAASSMAVYNVVLQRWAELRAFAIQEKMVWPLEPTLYAAFQVFAAAYNASTDGINTPSFSENPKINGVTNLTELQSLLFVPCPGGGASGTSRLASRTLPLAVHASKFVSSNHPPTLKGLGNLGPPPAWIQLTLVSPEATPSQVAGVQVQVGMMIPVGFSNHTLTLSLSPGDPVAQHSWSGVFPGGSTMRWSPARAVAARSIRLHSINNSTSWVDWRYISVFACE